jgi:hypothetical protein
MIPQLVQMWRGRLSPPGTRCSTGAPHALQKFIPMEGVGIRENQLYSDRLPLLDAVDQTVRAFG